MHATFNTLDLIFMVITVIFVITALLRGFIREFFAFANWIISFSVAYFISPYVTGLLASYFDAKIALYIVVRVVIFISVFVAILLLTSNLSKELSEKIPKIIDRSIGVLFAFVKSILIFGLVYSLSLNLYKTLIQGRSADAKTIGEPKVLAEARFIGLYRAAGEVVDPIVAGIVNRISIDFDFVKKFKPKTMSDKIDEILEDDKENYIPDPTSENLEDSATNINNSLNNSQRGAGYGKKEIDHMNRLMETIDREKTNP